MVEGKTIVVLATVPWSDAWQRQQEWARQFARHNRVLYVSPFGMTNHGPFRLARKLLARRGRPMYQHPLEHPAASNLQQVRLKFIPWHDVGWINTANARWLTKQLRPLLPGNLRDVILWACNPTDTVVALAAQLPEATLVYDIAMRFAKRHDAPSYIVRSQAELAERADLILYDNAASLSDLPAATHGKAHFVPQGLREQFYNLDGLREHPILAGIPHPRVGFAGAGHDAFDAAAVRSIVDRLPNVHVVLAGIYRTRDPQLEHPHVHYVGALPIDHLPRLLVGLDVGIIPYLINDYTIGVFPTKFFEYLAAGLPVVSTELPELRRYVEHVTFAPHADFAGAVERALERGRGAPDRAFLEQQSWDRRFAAVEKLLT